MAKSRKDSHGYVLKTGEFRERTGGILILTQIRRDSATQFTKQV